jgi:LPXTG-motif cell wall-anchored protein
MMQPEASLALNSTPRRRFGVGLGVVLTGAVAGLIGFAGVASAHVPEVSAKCTDSGTTLTVTLTKYDTRKKNTVKITDNDAVLVDTTQFKDSYSFKKADLANDVKHTFTVVVLAGDDPDGKKGFSFTQQKVVEACVTPPPTKTTESSTPPPTKTTESSTPPPVTTTTTVAAPVIATSTTPAAQATTPPLAETGASIAVPLGIAGVLLVGGGVLLFVVRRRSKA